MMHVPLIDSIQIILPSFDDIGLIDLRLDTLLVETCHVEGIWLFYCLLEFLQSIVGSVELLHLVFKLLYLGEVTVLLLF